MRASETEHNRDALLGKTSPMGRIKKNIFVSFLVNGLLGAAAFFLSDVPKFRKLRNGSRLPSVRISDSLQL